MATRQVTTQCRTCLHPDVEEVNAAIVAGTSDAQVGKRFGLSHDTVNRHRNNHLAPMMKQELETRQQRIGKAAVDRLEDLYNRASRLLTKAEQGGKTSDALVAIRELRQLVELLARLTGELDERTQVTVSLEASPEWLMVQQRVVAALAAYPEARAAVAGVLTAEPDDVVDAEIVDVEADLQEVL